MEKKKKESARKKKKSDLKTEDRPLHRMIPSSVLLHNEVVVDLQLKHSKPSAGFPSFRRGGGLDRDLLLLWLFWYSPQALQSIFPSLDRRHKGVFCAPQAMQVPVVVAPAVWGAESNVMSSF